MHAGVNDSAFGSRLLAGSRNWPLAVVDRLLAVDAETPTHFRDRGTVLVRLGRLHEGAAEWERYLSRSPAAQDAETFRQELRRVRQELGSRN